MTRVKLYADRPVVAGRQILTDLFVVAWVYGWIWAALKLHDLVQKLAVPGQKLEGAGTGIADNLADAGHRVDNVPLAGNALSSPFEKAANAARTLSDAGQQQQQIVGDLALALSIALVVVPLAMVVLIWLPLRVRWMRRAGAAAVLRGRPAGQDLLALRALASQPLRKLAALGPDVAASWRDSDEETIAALAALELRGLGLRAGAR